MMCFYQNLVDAAHMSPDVDIAEALRQTQLQMSKLVDVAGWSAFKLIGWPRMRMMPEAPEADA